MNRKLFSVITVIVMLISLLPTFSVFAETTYNGTKYDDTPLYYKANYDTYYVVDCDENATSIVIPESVNGCPVTKINENAFKNCTQLESVTIPESVTYIYNNAFEGCTALTSVNIPEGITTIQEETFKGCTSLTSITLHDKITEIRSDAFFNTGYYNDTTNWENGVLYIGKYLIAADKKSDVLESCEIKTGTKLIAYGTFRGNFVSVGMCADIAVHDKSDGNPHAHIMLTIRPLEQNGEWGAKSKKEYITDKNGERIKLKNGNFKTRKIDTVDWNSPDKAELWRSAWADIANKYLEKNAIDEHIDHRSFERQGTEQIPTIHLGVAASQMERKGIATERGNINREIKAHNKILAEIKSKISALKNWLADLFKQKKDIAEPNPVELVMQMQGQKQSIWNKVNILKDTATAVSYLQSNNITTLALLDEKGKSVNSQFNTIRKELIGVENRISDLSETVKQTDIYLKYREMYKKYVVLPKGKDGQYRLEHISEIILYEGAIAYLKEHLTDSRIYPQEWKTELKSLTERKQKLYSEYISLKDENKLLDDIKRTVNSALRKQGRQTPKRNIDYER